MESAKLSNVAKRQDSYLSSKRKSMQNIGYLNTESSAKVSSIRVNEAACMLK